MASTPPPPGGGPPPPKGSTPDPDTRMEDASVIGELYNTIDTPGAAAGPTTQAAASEPARSAVRTAAKALKDRMAVFTGKGDPRAFLKQWGMLVLLLTDIIDPAALSLLLVVFISDDALMKLFGIFGMNALLSGAVPVRAIAQQLMACFGRSKQLTDAEGRHKLQHLRVKRAADGSDDVSGYLSTFTTLRAGIPTPPDDITLISWVLAALPRHLADIMAFDGDRKPWTNFAAFSAALQHQASVTRNSRGGNPPSGQHQPPSKRFRKGGSKGGDKPAGRNEDKPSYNPDLSQEEVKRRRKGGLCFKCGKPGHKAADCPGHDLVDSAEAADTMDTVLESLEALELGDKELAQALLMSLDDSISSSSESEDADMAAAVAASLEAQDTADADLEQAIKASLADGQAKGQQPANLEQQMAQLTLTASSSGASSSSGAMLVQLSSSWPVIAEQYVSLPNAVSQGNHSVGVMQLLQLLQLSEMIPAALQLQPGSPDLDWVPDKIADLLGKVMTSV